MILQCYIGEGNLEERRNMYLVSLYFDVKTNDRIQQYINTVAKRTGNTYMLDGKVPPHITISAFESKHEIQVIERLDECVKELQSGRIQWASVGAFFPSVIYLSPVLNEYLHQVSFTVYTALEGLEDTNIRKCYKPFSWLPHTTISKKLSAEEMKTAFAVMQESFGMFSGEGIRIGLAKTNPYEDLVTWELG